MSLSAVVLIAATVGVLSFGFGWFLAKWRLRVELEQLRSDVRKNVDRYNKLQDKYLSATGSQPAMLDLVDLGSVHEETRGVRSGFVCGASCD